jgi:hypothetical protein
LPALRPTTVSGLAGPDFTIGTPPSLEVQRTVFPVIGLPLLAPEMNVTLI